MINYWTINVSTNTVEELRVAKQVASENLQNANQLNLSLISHLRSLYNMASQRYNSALQILNTLKNSRGISYNNLQTLKHEADNARTVFNTKFQELIVLKEEVEKIPPVEQVPIDDEEILPVEEANNEEEQNDKENVVCDTCDTSKEKKMLYIYFAIAVVVILILAILGYRMFCSSNKQDKSKRDQD